MEEFNWYKSRPDRKNNDIAWDEKQIPSIINSFNSQLDLIKNEASKYIPHPKLVDAVNLALALGKPLLVTGEPGTGKTKLGDSIAWQLGFQGPFKYVCKSTSEAKSLFYQYDAIGRFYAAETAKFEGATREDQNRPKNALNFIEFEALGKAILLAHGLKAIKDSFPSAADIFEQKWDELNQKGQTDFEPKRSVVIIDEIDKAPRDFPNDLLDEIDNLQFKIPELSVYDTPKITDTSKLPLIILTSNKERQLPDAFLRRCLFFEIPFPESRLVLERQGDEARDQLPERIYIEDIIDSHLKGETGFQNSPLQHSAIQFFYHIRKQHSHNVRKPGTAELIDWIHALFAKQADTEKSLKDQKTVFLATLPALLKDYSNIGEQIVTNWIA